MRRTFQETPKAMTCRAQCCTKNRNHDHFIPVCSLTPEHLPDPFRADPRWCSMLRARADDTVKLTVTFTCDHRPEPFKCQRHVIRHGSGSAFWTDSTASLRPCPLDNCGVAGGAGEHGVYGPFRLVTVAHLVYDKAEALRTIVEFFDDHPEDKSRVRTAQVIDFIEGPEGSDRSILVCVTHDADIPERLARSQQERNQLLLQLEEPEASSMSVLISHPHGMSKHISFGQVLQVEESGPVKAVQLADDRQTLLRDCVLLYTTPSCPGSGGGSLTLWSRGRRAFAPHCKSLGPGKNQSSLGWISVSNCT